MTPIWIPAVYKKLYYLLWLLQCFGSHLKLSVPVWSGEEVEKVKFLQYIHFLQLFLISFPKQEGKA